MSLSLIDTRRAICADCGYNGTLANLALHSCQIEEQGGRCEDYPCCGHTDGDGCQTLASHTSDFYHRNPQFLYEPGSPEWYDAMDAYNEPDEDEELCSICKQHVVDCGGPDEDHDWMTQWA